jgi:hypothetical protein
VHLSDDRGAGGGGVPYVIIEKKFLCGLQVNWLAQEMQRELSVSAGDL